MVMGQMVLLGFFGLLLLAWLAVALVRRHPGCTAMLVGAIVVWAWVLAVSVMR